MSSLLKKQIRGILYGILVSEIIIFSLADYFGLSVFLLSSLGMAMFVRFLSNRSFQPNMWVVIREKLTLILLANNIIPDDSGLPPISFPSTIHDDVDENYGLAIQINPNIVQELRSIGIDGILI
ncbi:MAG: hypothetical protein ACXAC2_25065, partial [Candidatus Kariarchaeaceae archaeon]